MSGFLYLQNTLHDEKSQSYRFETSRGRVKQWKNPRFEWTVALKTETWLVVLRVSQTPTSGIGGRVFDRTKGDVDQDYYLPSHSALDQQCISSG